MLTLSTHAEAHRALRWRLLSPLPLLMFQDDLHFSFLSSTDSSQSAERTIRRFCRCSKFLIKVCVFEEESESKVRPEGLFSLPLLSDLESNRVIRGNMPPVCLLLGIDTSLAEIVGFR